MRARVQARVLTGPCVRACAWAWVGVGVCEELTRAASVSRACAFCIRVRTRCVCGVVSSVMGRTLAPLMRQMVFVRARASLEVADPLRKRAIPLVTSTFECLILRLPPHAGLYLLRDLALIAACVYAASHIGALPAWAAPLAWGAYTYAAGLCMMGLWILAHECGHGAFRCARACVRVCTRSVCTCVWCTPAYPLLPVPLVVHVAACARVRAVPRSYALISLLVEWRWRAHTPRRVQ